MSASLQNLRDRINDERARIERALKNPGAVMIPKSASEPTTPLKLSSEVIDVPRQEPKKPVSELMQQGKLATEFKLAVSPDTVIEAAQNAALKNSTAAWFTCAPPKAPHHASQANLVLIRQLAASRALSMIVKTGGGAIPVISMSQSVWAPKLNPALSAASASKLASTSLQTISPRSAQLFSSVSTTAIEQPIAMKLAVHSSSTPNIAAAISASGSSRQARLSLPPLSEPSTDDPFADDDDDWLIEDDADFSPERSPTPPLPADLVV
jgi:hypothetical protein